jgi:hypothetical protein
MGRFRLDRVCTKHVVEEHIKFNRNISLYKYSSEFIVYIGPVNDETIKNEKEKLPKSKNQQVFPNSI